MRISLIQTDIVWENKKENLQHLAEILPNLKGKTDIIVLPEMFSTGFSMHSALLAETTDEETITTLRSLAHEYKVAITGSFIFSDGKEYFNRAFFITPNQQEYFYDKRHLFRMGNEPFHFKAGNHRLIFNYLNWNISIVICYDLRFPVWCRNINNEYDLLIVVANWPAKRRRAWEILLCARAIENQCYVCGVNRIGIDGNDIQYSGQSCVFNAKGENMANFADNEEGIQTVDLDLNALQAFRNKFPSWKDADTFSID